MIPVIPPPVSSVKYKFLINDIEGKIAKGNAQKLVTRNLGQDDGCFFKATIEERRRASHEMPDKAVFQLKLHLEPGDGLTDSDAVNVLDRVMDHLGLEKQPYTIYRQNVEGRVIYKVIASRIAETGDVIRQPAEFQLVRQALRELAKTFPFTLSNRHYEHKK